MKRTKMSNNGQVIIPKSLCSAHHWDAGLEPAVIEKSESVLLQPKSDFEETRLADVAGSLTYNGGAKSDADVEQVLKSKIKQTWCNQE